MIITINAIRVTDDTVNYVYVEEDTIDIDTNKIVYITRKDEQVFCLYLINNHRVELDVSEIHKLRA